MTALDEAIERGTRRLLELQRPDGIWVGELESNVTMTAQHLFWNHALGLRTPDMDRRIANELMARMRDDGTWSIWFEGPADLSTSLEAYVALRMCGVDPGPKTLAYLQRAGGIPKARIFTKCFLALLGQWPWQRMVPIPPELVLLPAGGKFSIYDFACWARQTFVALSVAQSQRPVRPIDVDLRMLGARPGRTRPPRRPNALRRRALAEAERWMRARQEADGSWGGIQPPWVWGIVALSALGHGREDETLRRAIDGWAGFMVEDGDRLRPEACQSPVWDTALAVLALRACGVPADHPQLARAGEYLLREEVTVKGDWAVRVPGLAPGGWAFEYENDNYPDIDDAAVVPLALRALGIGDDAVRRGLDWMAGMQSKDGGWGAFDVDNERHVAVQDPVLRLRQGHRRAERGRDGARARGARAGADTSGRSSAGCAGSSRSRRRTARGSAAGASTICTAPAPRCRRSRRAGSAATIRRPSRARVARLRAARRRRLRRGHPLVPRPLAPRARGLRDAVADRLGAARPRGRRKR